MTYYMMKKKLAELLEKAVIDRMRKKARKEYTVDQDIYAMENLTIKYLEIVDEYNRENAVCAKELKSDSRRKNEN